MTSMLDAGPDNDSGDPSATDSAHREPHIAATRRVRRIRGWRRALSGGEASAEIILLFVVVQAGAIVAGLLFKDDFAYLSRANVSIMLKSVPVLGLLALGVGVLMIAGEFDLSVGANYTFSAVVAAKLLTEHNLMPVVAVAAGLGVGISIALLNGFVTIWFKIPSFIATLGAMLFWQGAVLLVHGATAIRISDEQGLRSLFAGSVGPIESAFLWMLGFAAMAYVLLHRHVFGNRLYAVGGNAASARAIGISPTSVKLIAFGIAGGMAAFAGLLATTRVGSIQPGQGSGLELQAIAACVIGGVALRGGRGTAIGIVLGAALMFIIQDILLLLRAPGYYLNMFVGALIVFAAIVNQVTARRASQADD